MESYDKHPGSFRYGLGIQMTSGYRSRLPHLPAGEPLGDSQVSVAQSSQPSHGPVVDTVGTCPHPLDTIPVRANPMTSLKLQAPRAFYLRNLSLGNTWPACGAGWGGGAKS